MAEQEYTQSRPLEYPYSAAYDLGYATDSFMFSEGRVQSNEDRLAKLSVGLPLYPDSQVNEEVVTAFRNGMRDAWYDHMNNLNQSVFGE